MFFLLVLKKDLLMHPSSFGPRLHDAIKKALYQDVEGTVDTRYGFIIAVTKVIEIPLGEVQEGGFVKFSVNYQAIIFRPFRNQVLDAVVLSVDTLGVRCQAGPLTIFVHKDQIPADYSFDASGPAYVLTDETARISEGELLRLKLTGLRFDSSGGFGVGTIREDYLGLIS